MAGIGLLLLLVLLQIVVSFAGARRYVGRGPGFVLLSALAVPAVLVMLATVLMLEAGGFSESFAQATPIFAAVFLVLLLIGSIAAWVGQRQRK
jgi:hypothetical protein